MGRKPCTHLYYRRQAGFYRHRKYVYYRWDPTCDKLIYRTENKVSEPTGSQKRGYAYIKLRVDDDVIAPVLIGDVPFEVIRDFEAYRG